MSGDEQESSHPPNRKGWDSTQTDLVGTVLNEPHLLAMDKSRGCPKDPRSGKLLGCPNGNQNGSTRANGETTKCPKPIDRWLDQRVQKGFSRDYPKKTIKPGTKTQRSLALDNLRVNHTHSKHSINQTRDQIWVNHKPFTP